MNRTNTRIVKIKDLTLGGNNEVVIQSMCTTKTSKVKKVIKEINEAEFLGAKIMRISILDDNDIKAIKKIKENTTLPLVADIHYTLDYAIKAIKAGIDGIRINPGNTKNNKLLDEVLRLAKEKNVLIRIGINRGSIEINKNKDISTQLIRKMKEYVTYFEKHDFYNTVLSIKDSDPLITLKVNRLLAKKFSYPLHIGVTEAGIKEVGIIRNVSILSILLSEGIGSTIRISLTSNIKEEILTAKRLLHDLNLYKDYPTIISCPTCGRCLTKNNENITRTVLNYLEENNINDIKIAIMGCVVNGIKESENASLGLLGVKNGYILFKNGKKIKNVSIKDAANELIEEIKNYK